MQAMSQLFSPEDYEACDDDNVREVFEVMSGTKKASEATHINTTRFYLTENRYLMRHDPVTNVMATVVPCKTPSSQLT